MTTPPCEEYVVWFVYEKPLKIGSTALGMIRDALFNPGKTAIDKEANYDGSYRNTQNIYDRKVYFYDKKHDCENPYKDDADGFKGHWEKVDKKVDRYFYIGGANPSGIPNSFVVSKDEAELGSNETPRTDDRFRLDNLN